jgi:hypothetical protein
MKFRKESHNDTAGLRTIYSPGNATDLMQFGVVESIFGAAGQFQFC